MKNIRVLLACGSGASTGFMATSMRKSAKKKGIEADIKARSESEIDKYLSEIDCLLLWTTFRLYEGRNSTKG